MVESLIELSCLGTTLMTEVQPQCQWHDWVENSEKNVTYIISRYVVIMHENFSKIAEVQLNALVPTSLISVGLTVRYVHYQY